MRQALADDLRSPAALEAVDDWCRGAGTSPEATGLIADAVDALLGVRL
jgi:L-cysteine:1D-myo-inositol 2-amino-2-deoxy-alpha-D-glucopyranoside ligase